MPRTARPIAILILGSLVLLSAGCGDSAPTVEQAQSGALPIGTVREGEEYRATLASGRSISWTVAPGPAQSCTADADAVRIVRDAVNSSAAEIAQLDFSALSLPRFLTVTRTLKLDSTSWQSAEVEIDACGSEGSTDKWQIYSVIGPEFEQIPGAPGALIHRWPHIYALYDVEERTVKRLLASIRGYVLE